MKTGIVLLSAIILMPCLSLTALAQTTKLSRHQQVALSADEAVAYARSILGITGDAESATDADSSVTFVMFRDTTTPFVKQLLDKRPAWHVTLSIDTHAKRSPRQQSNTALAGRSFDIYVDTSTGTILRVESSTASNKPDTTVSVTAAAIQEMLSRTSERYVGLPEEPPKTGFLDALATTTFVTNPYVATRMIGVYVMFSNMQRPAVPVWVISLYGVGHPRRRSGQEKFLRCVVNAQTGEFLLASTVKGP